MTFDQVLPLMRNGRRARRDSWPRGVSVFVDAKMNKVRFVYKHNAPDMAWDIDSLSMHDVLSEDWRLEPIQVEMVLTPVSNDGNTLAQLRVVFEHEDEDIVNAFHDHVRSFKTII